MMVVNVPPKIQTRPRLAGHMSQGPMGAPKPSDAAIAKLRSDVDSAILELDNRIGDIAVYAGLLSTNVLRAQPDAYRSIPDIADSFTPEELRTIIADDALVLGNIASRLWNGAAGHYITGDQAKALQQLSARATGLISAIKAGPTSAVSNLDLAYQQQEDVSQNAGALMEAVERDVVAAEAGAVPVLEPYEKDSQTVSIVIGTGIAAVVIFGLWSLLS